jgi:hypothetical protein
MLMVALVARGCHGRSAIDRGATRPEAAAAIAGPLAVAAASDAGVPAAALPDDVATFVASPLVSAQGFSRRRYARGAISIEVTIARSPVDDAGYAEWVRQAGAYPTATLDVPPGSASGFYSCGDDGGHAAACDLHIQTRSGFHVEMMGAGRATRADLDDLVRHLPLR